MKIDFSAELTGLTGDPLKDETGAVINLGMVCIHVLLTPLTDPARGQPENPPATEKVRFANLAQDIFTSTKPLDLGVEDVGLLKERIGRAFPPLTVARAWELLDPKGL